MKKMAFALALTAILSSGCHAGLMGFYGCTGEQYRKGSLVTCPKCGGSKIDRFRCSNLPSGPIGPLFTHEYYCQGCRAWWGTNAFGRGYYEHGPGWPFKGE
jgi:hypothetical protein